MGRFRKGNGARRAVPPERADEERAADLLARIAAEPDGPAAPGAPPDRRRRLVSALADVLGRGATAGARGAGRGARAAGRTAGRGARSLADRLIDAAPRIPVRRLETLQAQFPGLTTEELADKLVIGAERSTAAVGAGIGAAAMLPNPVTMPVELTAETLAVAVVEVKLVAELHEAYGVPAEGGGRQRAMAYLAAWANRRGLDVTHPSSLTEAVSSGTKREVRNRLLKRTVRSAPSVTPFLIGAGVGAVMNHRDTKKLAERIRADLRRRQLPEGAADSSAPAVGAEADSSARARRLGKRVER